MKNGTIADLVVSTLRHAEVRRIYGVVGDSLNGITDALRRDGTIEWVHLRHEEAAAFAACGEAQVTGTLAVCAGSCGPGNLHLINGLFDAHRTRVPVLAIAAQIPSAEIGSGYFQETHPQHLFKECSHFCEIVTSAEQMPRMLDSAIRAAVGQRGVAVLVIPGDVAMLPAPAAASPAAGLLPAAPVARPPDAQLDALARLLDAGRKVTLFCGRGCAGSHAPLMRLAEALRSPIVHALGGKEHVEWDNPYDVGMTGLIGFSSGYHAMMDCDTLLMLGTDFPYRQFFPTEATIAQVDLRPGEPRPPLPARPRPGGRRGRHDRGAAAAADGQDGPRAPRPEPRQLRQGARGAGRARDRRGGPQADPPAVRRQDRQRPGGRRRGVHLRRRHPDHLGGALPAMNGRRRMLGSLVHGSMANAMPQAIGAQAIDPGRQVISLSGDGGFTMLMGDFISLVQLGLPVKVVIFNNGALGFVELEMKATGFLETGVELQNPDFAAMARAMGVHAARVEDPADLAPALRDALAHPGPALVDVVTNRTELAMPPKITAAEVGGLRPVGRQGGDERPRHRADRPRPHQHALRPLPVAHAPGPDRRAARRPGRPGQERGRHRGAGSARTHDVTWGHQRDRMRADLDRPGRELPVRGRRDRPRPWRAGRPARPLAGALLYRRGPDAQRGLSRPWGRQELAGPAAGLLTQAGLPVGHRLVAVCPCMVLVPGLHLLNGSGWGHSPAGRGVRFLVPP